MDKKGFNFPPPPVPPPGLPFIPPGLAFVPPPGLPYFDPSYGFLHHPFPVPAQPPGLVPWQTFSSTDKAAPKEEKPQTTFKLLRERILEAIVLRNDLSSLVRNVRRNQDHQHLGRLLESYSAQKVCGIDPAKTKRRLLLQGLMTCARNPPGFSAS